MNENQLPQWVQQATLLPVAFSIVREDALLDKQVVEELFQQFRRPVSVLMIASGGCTACTLAGFEGVESLHLIDPNPAQLALTRLKLALLQTTEKEERLALLGHLPMNSREDSLTELWKKLKLPQQVLGPWKLVCQEGPDFVGRYEQVFSQLRKELLPDQKELFTLLKEGSSCALELLQPGKGFYARLEEAFERVMKLDYLVALFGKEATQNTLQPFSKHFFERTFQAFFSLNPRMNPYLWNVLAGRFPENTPLPWLKIPITHSLPSIQFDCLTLSQTLQKYSDTPAQIDFLHLSNILDWLSETQAQTLLNQCWTLLKPGGRVLIRQLNSKLNIPQSQTPFSWEQKSASELHKKDSSYFYRALHLGQKT